MKWNSVVPAHPATPASISRHPPPHLPVHHRVQVRGEAAAATRVTVLVLVLLVVLAVAPLQRTGQHPLRTAANTRPLLVRALRLGALLCLPGLPPRGLRFLNLLRPRLLIPQP